MTKYLTISVAVYNIEKYIKECIESVIQSKYKDKIDLILVNDGSSDNSLKVLENYRSLYPETIQIISRENKGYASTINDSLQSSKGIYFKLLDGDDYLNTESLDLLIEYIDKNINNLPDIIFTKCVQFFDCSYKFRKVEQLAPDGDCTNVPIEVGQPVYMRSITIKTTLMKTNNFNLPLKVFYTDAIFTMHSFLQSSVYTTLPLDLYFYRIGRQGQSIENQAAIKNLSSREIVFDYVLTSVKNNLNSFFKNGFAKISLINYINDYFSILSLIKDKRQKYEKFINVVNKIKNEISIYSYLQQNIHILKLTNKKEVLKNLNKYKKKDSLKSVLKKIYFSLHHKKVYRPI